MNPTFFFQQFSVYLPYLGQQDKVNEMKYSQLKTYYNYNFSIKRLQSFQLFRKIPSQFKLLLFQSTWKAFQKNVCEESQKHYGFFYVIKKCDSFVKTSHFFSTAVPNTENIFLQKIVLINEISRSSNTLETENDFAM